MAEKQREYHLWRNISHPPYTRFACTVAESDDAEAGYRIVDHDPDVADAVFLHKLHDYMLKPHPIHVPVEDPEGIFDGVKIAHAKEPGHFEEAIRTVPGTRFSGVGRGA